MKYIFDCVIAIQPLKKSVKKDLCILTGLCINDLVVLHINAQWEIVCVKGGTNH